MLAPGLVHRHGNSIGQVEAAAAVAHWQAHALLGRQVVAHLLGQAAAFRAEQEGVAGLIADLMEGLRALGGEREYTRLTEACQAAG